MPILQTPARSQPIILIVEDDLPLAELIADYLRDHGYARRSKCGAIAPSNGSVA